MLINCPGCTKRISEFAECCPHCGGNFTGSCPECGSARGIDDDTCSKCGFPFASDKPDETDSSEEALDRPTKSYSVADNPTASLAVCFWVYLVLLGNVGGSIVLSIWAEASPESVVLGMIIYILVIWVLWAKVWTASDIYLGPRVWATLAKAYVVWNALISLAMLIISVAFLTGAPIF
jgi:hypothetical protein